MQRLPLRIGILAFSVPLVGCILIVIGQYMIQDLDDMRHEERRLETEKYISQRKFDLNKNICEELSYLTENGKHSIALGEILQFLGIDTFDGAIAEVLPLSLIEEEIRCDNVKILRDTTKENSSKTIRIDADSFRIDIDKRTKKLRSFYKKDRQFRSTDVKMSSELVLDKVVRILKGFDVFHCADLQILDDESNLIGNRYEFYFQHRELNFRPLMYLSIRTDGIVEALRFDTYCIDSAPRILVAKEDAENVAITYLSAQQGISPKVQVSKLSMDRRYLSGSHVTDDEYTWRYVWAVGVEIGGTSFLKLPWTYFKVKLLGARYNPRAVVTVDVETGEIVGTHFF